VPASSTRAAIPRLVGRKGKLSTVVHMRIWAHRSGSLGLCRINSALEAWGLA
jgi:hypothetical protein